MSATEIDERLAALSQRRRSSAQRTTAQGTTGAPQRVTAAPEPATAEAQRSAGPMSVSRLRSASPASPASPAARPARPARPGRSETVLRWRRRLAILIVNLLIGAAALEVVSALRPEPTTLADPRGMVRVSAGTYVVGAGDRPGPQRASARVVTVRDFWIMRNEMTVAQLAALTADTADAAVVDAVRVAGSEPARGVDLATAEQACAAIGGRLPSEAEWEIAGRGPAGVRRLGAGTPGGRAGLSAFGVAGLQSAPAELVDMPYSPTPSGTVLVRGGADLVTRRAVRDVTSARAGFRCVADHVAGHLEDDFSEPGRAPVLAGVPTGAAVRSGALRIPVRDATILPVGVDAGDARIAATFAGRDGAARYGLVARSGRDGAYVLMVDPAQRTWRLERRSAGRRSLLAQGAAALLQAPAGPDRLALAAVGEWIEASVDGVLVARVADRRLGSGDLGVLVEPRASRRSRVSLDDLVVDLAVLDPNTRSS